MTSKLLLLLLPALAVAEISINIRGGNSVGNSHVDVSGSVTDIISDPERDAFRINDGQLKDAVNRYTGGRPDDTYVRSPTPWDDLYKRFGWIEVRRTLVARSGRVLHLNTQPTIIAKKEYHNNGPRVATYSGDISILEDNTATHKWTKGGSITVGQKISYSVTVGTGSLGGTTSFSYKHNFGEEGQTSVSTKLGSGSSVSLDLQPGQSARAVLIASKGTMDVEIEYEATLSGDVACNYGRRHKGHNFWAFDINGVLDAGGLPRTVTWKEVVHIGFYSDEYVTLEK